MRHRSHRIVKLTFGEARAMWVVVSLSMRDDDTWDVIARFTSAGEAFDYVEEVVERNAEIAAATGCGERPRLRSVG